MFVFEKIPKVVSLGGSTVSRIKGREAVAESKVTIELPDEKGLKRCLKFLEESDRRLANSGGSGAPYDWQFVLTETLQNGAAKVHFGVAWYDQAFFEKKKTIFSDAHHQNIFEMMGVGLDKVSVEHWIKSV